MDFIKNLFSGSGSMQKNSILIMSVLTAASQFKSLGLLGEAKTMVKLLVPNVQEEADIEALIDAGLTAEVSAVALFKAWQKVSPYLHPAVAAAAPAPVTPSPQ